MAIRLAIEINQDNFKLACVEQQNLSYRILNLVKKDFPVGASDVQVSELIKNSLADLKIKFESVACILPRHQTTVRMIKLPSIVEDELRGMVDIQTVRLIPYPKEKIIYDYQVIAEENNAYSWVHVGIVNRDIVDRILNILSGAQLAVDSLTLSTDGSLSWFLTSSGAGVEAVVLVNVDTSFLDVSVVQRGLTIFSRSVSFENISFDANSIVSEIDKTIFSFRKEELFLTAPEQFEVRRIILMGNKVMLEKIKPLLPLELADKTMNLSPKIIEEQAQAFTDLYNSASFCNVLGVVFNRRKIINFVPQEVEYKFKTSEQKKHYSYIGILLLGIVLMSSLLVYKKTSDKARFIANLKKKIAEEDILAKDIKIAKSRLTTISEWNSKKKLCIDILKELYSLTPNEISLTVLNYDVNTPLILQGSAKNMSDIFKYVSILEQSNYFQNVQIRYATKRKIRNQELTDFQLNCPFKTVTKSKE